MVNNRKQTTTEDTWQLAMGRPSLIPGLNFFDGEKAKEDVEKAKEYADTGSKVLKQIRKLADTAKTALSKIGLGGSDQDRFIKRTLDVFGIFKDAGYNGQGGISYVDYKLGKSQVDNNKQQSYWHAAFMRLRKYIIDRLDDYNPGLGAAYGELFPDFKMANEGQMIGEPIEALKLLVKAFPPGSYKEGANGESLLASATVAAGRSSESGPDNETKKAETQQMVTYVTVGFAVVLLIIVVIVRLKNKAS